MKIAIIGKRPSIIADALRTFEHKVNGQRIMAISVSNDNGKATIRIDGRISRYWNNAEEFRMYIDELVAQGTTDAELYINTIGGDVFEANEIGNIISAFPGKITGKGGAMVASAGTYIACKCDTFHMPANGQFMIHKPSGSFEGNQDQIESSLQLLKNITGDYFSTYAKKTGKSAEEIKALCDTGDYWMSAADAKAQRFIDGIYDEEVEITSEIVAELKASGCPNVPKITATTTRQTPKNEDTMNKEQMQALAIQLGLDSNATIEQIMAKSMELKAAADEGTRISAEAKTAQTERATKMITAAIEAKKITEEHRAGFMAKFEANFAATEKELEAIAPVPTMSAELGGGGSGTPGIDAARKDWKYAEWMEKDPKGLQAMMKDNYDSFNALHKEEYGTDAPKAE